MIHIFDDIYHLCSLPTPIWQGELTGSMSMAEAPLPRAHRSHGSGASGASGGRKVNSQKQHQLPCGKLTMVIFPSKMVI